MPGRLSGQSTASCTRRSQAARTFSGLPEHVDDDSPGAAQSVAQDVEGGFGRRAGVGREAQAHDFAHGGEDHFGPRAEDLRRFGQPLRGRPPSPAEPQPPTCPKTKGSSMKSSSERHAAKPEKAPTVRGR